MIPSEPRNWMMGEMDPVLSLHYNLRGSVEEEGEKKKGGGREKRKKAGENLLLSIEKDVLMVVS